MASNVRFLDQVPVSAYSSTSDAINTGSFMVTGSVDSSNKLTFTKGDGSTFELQVAASASSADALVTASVSASTMTFRKGDDSTFDVTLPSGGGSDITYQTNPAQIIQDIDVQNFDTNVAVSFTGNKLKFVFGTPTVPTPSFTALTSTGFNVDRFNAVEDTYNLVGTFNIGGYDLISASMFETTGGGNVLIQNVGTGTSGFNISQTTTGSVSYQMQVTASSPMDGSIYSQSFNRSGTLSKSSPAIPTIAYTPSVQLGATSNQIEIGATGSIAFTATEGAGNGWVYAAGTLSTNFSSPVTLTTSSLENYSISASADYSSSGTYGADNNPAITTTVTSATKTYSRIRSLRYGATTSISQSAAQLQDLSNWDTSLGGNVGVIEKGTINPNSQEIDINWSGSKFIYIIYDSSQGNLTDIVERTTNFSIFEPTFGARVYAEEGNYKIYRTGWDPSTSTFEATPDQAGGTGTTLKVRLVK